MNLKLQKKLASLRKNINSGEFILADAKDANMAYGIPSPGVIRETGQYRSMGDFRRSMVEIVRQKEIDILLASVSQLSFLEKEWAVFSKSGVTPAIRMNDTTDVWVGRSAAYRNFPSRPFSTSTLEDVLEMRKKKMKVDLGLYSVTFNNDLERDLQSLEAFQKFRLEASKNDFHYFFEVFAPNVECGIAPDKIPFYVNDQIVRTLAGIPKSNWPEFLKIPYFGPKAMEELVNYEPSLLVGILGGGSGTTYDAFKLLSEAQKYGARIALFGRKIKDAESPLDFVRYLRAIVSHQLKPEEAVRAYHGDLKKNKIEPLRSLSDDLRLTSPEMSYVQK